MDDDYKQRLKDLIIDSKEQDDDQRFLQRLINMLLQNGIIDVLNVHTRVLKMNGYLINETDPFAIDDKKLIELLEL